jgi:hypothetical protein
MSRVVCFVWQIRRASKAIICNSKNSPSRDIPPYSQVTVPELMIDEDSGMTQIFLFCSWSVTLKSSREIPAVSTMMSL